LVLTGFEGAGDLVGGQLDLHGVGLEEVDGVVHDHVEDASGALAGLNGQRVFELSLAEGTSSAGVIGGVLVQGDTGDDLDGGGAGSAVQKGGGLDSQAVEGFLQESRFFLAICLILRLICSH